MSFAEDIKNSNKCPDGSSCTVLCDNCEYKDIPECVPPRIADNLKKMGYGLLEPMDAGITIKGVFKCVFLFEDHTYIELDNEMIKTCEDVNYIKINDTVFRKVKEDGHTP